MKLILLNIIKENIMNFDKISKATELVIKSHGSQLRKNSDIFYFYHCFDVTKKALSYNIKLNNISKEDFECTCLFHDLLEDTTVTFDYIKENFGESIANIVKEVTFEKELSSKFVYMKTFLNKSDGAVVLKVADRVCNIFDFAQHDKKYAGKYALQAYPLYAAYLSRKNILSQRVLEDLEKVQYIIRTSYNVSIFNAFDCKDSETINRNINEIGEILYS